MPETRTKCLSCGHFHLSPNHQCGRCGPREPLSPNEDLTQRTGRPSVRGTGQETISKRGSI